MLKPFHFALITSGLFLAAGLSACGSSDAEQVETITVANIEGNPTLVWIADDKGYFGNNNLDVTTKDYSSGTAAVDAVLAGEADISISAEFVFVSNSFTNRNLRILGAVDSREIMELIAIKDREIIVPRDLKGRRIGVTKKSAAEFFLGTFLTYNGIGLADVEVVDVNPEDMAETLISGGVDAVLTWPPITLGIKQQLGNSALSWSGQNGRKYHMVLMTTDEYIKEKPDTIRRFIKSLVQAEGYASSNITTLKRDVAEEYNIDPSLIELLWENLDFALRLSQELLLIMEDEARWRISNGLTNAERSPNYLNYIYFEALEEANPDAVTIIR